MIIYIENAKQSMNKQLQRINEPSKVFSDTSLRLFYCISMQSNSKQMENEIYETVLYNNKKSNNE